MRSIVSALLLMTTLSGLSTAGEMPFDPVHYEAMRNSGKPFAVGVSRRLVPDVPCAGARIEGIDPVA